MGKWIFRVLLMLAIGGGVIVTAQLGDKGQRENGMSGQTAAETKAAQDETSDGAEGKDSRGEAGGTGTQSGEDNKTSAGRGDGLQTEKKEEETVRKELTDLYFQAFSELIQSDPGLGEGAACFGFDFSKAGSLTQREKETLAERLKKKFHKKKIIFGTQEELVKAGCIKKDDVGCRCWEDGMLLTLEVTKEKKKSIVFSISAWRSSLGAIGRDNCKVERTAEGRWKMKEGHPVNCWIS